MEGGGQDLTQLRPVCELPERGKGKGAFEEEEVQVVQEAQNGET